MSRTYCLSKQSVGFIFVLFATLCTMLPSQVDTLLQGPANERLGSIPGAVFCMGVSRNPETGYPMKSSPLAM